MRINSQTLIEGKNVILVPYRAKHVLKYHEWMKSPELQHFTASEPLTLKQEYEMQKSWLKDEDKCTFIILDRVLFEMTHNEVDAMIGDTNLFFNNSEQRNIAEAEIMIAEPKSRGKRMGWEAMVLMLRYGIDNLKVSKYIVKISLDNERSIKMFLKLKFKEESRSEVFKECTLEKEVDEEWLEWIKCETAHGKINFEYE